MGSHVKQTSELVDIRAALKRAAYKAVHGTREERSGRFLPGKPLAAKRPGDVRRNVSDNGTVKRSGKAL